MRCEGQSVRGILMEKVDERERIPNRETIVANRGKVEGDELQLSCDQRRRPAIVRAEVLRGPSGWKRERNLEEHGVSAVVRTPLIATVKEEVRNFVGSARVAV